MYGLRGFLNNVAPVKKADLLGNKLPKASKADIYKFLEDKYNMSERDAENAWDYLAEDQNVLNEVEYFAKTGHFVPADKCYRVEGYSAEDIFKSTRLVEIGAYNYLIYLKHNPKQALQDLKNGLPIK